MQQIHPSAVEPATAVKPEQTCCAEERSSSCRDVIGLLSIALILFFFYARFPLVAELKHRNPKLRGHRGSTGGLLPEPEDRPAVRPDQLRPRGQPGGSVRDASTFSRMKPFMHNAAHT